MKLKAIYTFNLASFFSDKSDPECFRQEDGSCVHEFQTVVGEEEYMWEMLALSLLEYYIVVTFLFTLSVTIYQKWNMTEFL